MVENLDPFVSIRHLLIDAHHQNRHLAISAVAYGAGYRIEHMFRELLVFGSPTLVASVAPVVFYWGDLDYEGIRIYEQLCARYPDVSIVSWTAGPALAVQEGEH